jgi:type I restriction enzyme S subunit
MTSEVAPFGELVEFTIGGGWGSEEGEVPVTVIRGTDFAAAQHGDLTGCPMRYETRKRTERRAVRPGDILLEISGGSKASGQTTGRSLLVTDEIAGDSGRAVIPASFSRLIRLDRTRVLPRYAYYHLRGMYLSGRAGLYENQSTGISNFQFKYFLENEQIWLPALSEQQRVAWVLGSLDDKIENNRRIVKTLEQIAAALFKARFVDFVDRDDLVQSDIGPIPSGWDIAPVGEVVQVVGGSTPSTKDLAYWHEGTHCWATPKDLSGRTEPVLLDTARHITDAGVDRISSGLLPSRTVLMSSRAPVGYTAISMVPIAVNQGFVAVPPSGDVPSEYVLFWMRANMDRIKAHAGGTTFAEISKRAFRPLPMLVPPEEQLVDFKRVAAALIDRIAACVQETNCLASLRDALLPKLIAGEVRVRQADAVDVRA